MRGVLSLLTIGSALVMPSMRASPQDLSGQAIEDSTRQPLVKFQVVLWRLLDDSARLVDSTRTDDRGLFQLFGVGSGRYQLRFGTWAAPIGVGPVDSVLRDAVVHRSYRLPVLRMSAANGFDLTQVDAVATPLDGHLVAEYPRALRRRCVDGDVMSSIVIGADGAPEMRTFRVESASHAGFVDAVRAAFAGSRFHPALIGGVPVRQRLVRPFQFRADCRR